LRENEVKNKVTVQKICRVCRDEKEIRAVLDDIWQDPSKAQEVFAKALNRNQDMFEFEKALIS
jgi:F0F1-type ATP synthase delta subunit